VADNRLRRTAISTARLDLRLLQIGDAGDVFAYARDPAVAKFTSWAAHTKLADAEAFVAAAVAADADLPRLVRHTWGIRQRGDATVIGTIGLIQTSATVAEAHFALARPCWMQGLTSEALQAVVSWGFAHVAALDEICSGCLADNVGSWRVLEKSRFRLNHTNVLAFGPKFDHRRLPVRYYALDRTAWLSATYTEST